MNAYYLGQGTILATSRPQAGLTLSLIQQPGDTAANTDGGDAYTGLDRFGRVIDQNWVRSNGTSAARYQSSPKRNAFVLKTGKTRKPPGFGGQLGYFTAPNILLTRGFRVRPTIRRRLQQRKRRIDQRNQPTPGVERPTPMMAASNIHYDLADRTRAIAAGGIGAIHLLAQKIGLVQDIDDNLHLLKRHLPYHESDHVLAIAYNLLAGGSRLEHLDIRRQDEVFLDALGAQRLPDPTTAGDFYRRFTPPDIDRLMDTINAVRLRVWKEQPADFFDEAFLDADGTLAPTGGWCKQGINCNYEGVWGYHPLLVSLANTSEPLFLLNRSANRPSHEDAHVDLDKAIALCPQAGFRRVTLRGDTDFSQTKHLDRWDEAGVGFVFGIDAMTNLKALADDLPATASSELERPTRPIRTEPRQARVRHRERIVREREFRTLKLMGEEVAEFAYQPTACTKSYRVIVLRKKLVVEKGQQWLIEPDRLFFSITNDPTRSAQEIVFLANDRCDQENLIAQLKGGVRAMANPVDTLLSNGASMVMASLAWSLKAWAALLLPEHPRWQERHRREKRSLLRMEFARFCVAWIQMPCQIVRSGRRLVYRLLSWNAWQGVFLRLVDRLHSRRLC